MRLLRLRPRRFSAYPSRRLSLLVSAQQILDPVPHRTPAPIHVSTRAHRFDINPNRQAASHYFACADHDLTHELDILVEAIERTNNKKGVVYRTGVFDAGLCRGDTYKLHQMTTG